MQEIEDIYITYWRYQLVKVNQIMSSRNSGRGNATTGEIDVMHVNTSTIIPVRWHRGVLVASVPMSLYERCGVHPTETSASIELECSRN